MIYCYSASDYACFKSGKFSVYYGSELTDPITGDWLFEVKKNDKVVFTATNAQLLEYCSEPTPLGMLMAGLALYFANK